MLRLAAGRPAALSLALALLNAWTAGDGQPMNCDLRRWLHKVSPVCLRMITDACQSNPGSAGSNRQGRC